MEYHLHLRHRGKHKETMESNVTKVGNMVIFGANMEAIRALARQDTVDLIIVGVKSEIKSKIQEKRMYLYAMKLKRRRRDKM